jgi:putative flippase GtrA
MARRLLYPGPVSKAKKRFLRVSMGGLLSSVVDVTALLVFVEVLAMHVTGAALLAAAAGAVSSFCISKFWAFGDRSPLRLPQVASFAFVAVAAALLLASGVHVLAVWLRVPYLVAKALSALAVFVGWTYPAQARFVFAPCRRF